MAGFWGTTWVVGPFAAVFVIIGLALLLFGLTSGQGLGVPPMLPGAVASYLALVALFTTLGAIAGAVVGLVSRVLPGSIKRAISARADRPVRLLPRRPWRWLVGVPAALTLVLLVLLTGVGFYLGRQVDHRLTAAIAAADRDDPHWKLGDLMAHREAVPDEENSALVVAEALALLPEGWPPMGTAPAPGVMPPQAEVSKACHRVLATPDNVRLDDPTADLIRGALETRKDAVRIARTAADYGRGRHELVVGPLLFNTLLPDAQAARIAARLLSSDAAIRVHDGDLDGALDSCRGVIGVGRSIGDEPFLISQLVRVAIGEVAMTTARHVLGKGEPSDEALARLQALLLDERKQPLLLHGLRGERAVYVELIRKVGDSEIPISALSGDSAPMTRDLGNSLSAFSGEGRPLVPGGPRTPMAPWGKLLFENQRAITLEWMNEVVSIARRPPADWPTPWRAWQDEFERVRHSRLGPFVATLPLLLCPGLDASRTAYSRYQCGLGAMVIMLAAERHRRKHGDWPASIEAIDPVILSNPPTDPYSGKPFLIDHRNGQFLVHSIGPNLKDEHGLYEPKRWASGEADDVGSGAWDPGRRRQSPPPPTPEVYGEAGPTP